MDPKNQQFYKDLFISTARDYLKSIEESLSLIKNDSSNQEVIEKLHIAFHSLGSQSLVMGFATTGAFCRKNEAILSEIRKNQSPLNQPLIEELSKSKQIIEASISNIETQGAEVDLTNDTKSLEEKEASLR